MQKLLLVTAFVTVLVSGFALSWKSIPNQEGYTEIFWNVSHIDFSEIIRSPSITPLNFLVAIVIERTLHLSVANVWKLMDLIFAGSTALFLTHIYLQKYSPKTLFHKLAPIIIIVSSVGFVYSFTSMSGEGMPVFFALLGLYYWQKRSFILATLCFITSFLAKYTIYLIGPGVLIWTLMSLRTFSRKDIRQLFISTMLFLASLWDTTP